MNKRNGSQETFNDLPAQSIFVPVGKEGAELHLLQIKSRLGKPKAAALLLHGAIENGRIFCNSKVDKGLGPYLASQGFEVFVADLRGRGLSRPRIDRHSSYGQTESITEDLTAFAEAVQEQTQGLPQHWLAHSWGGVLMASHLLRYPDRKVESLSFFGTKRSISVINWERVIAIDLIWNRLAPLAARVCGYLPAIPLKMGSDNETRRSLADSVEWVSTRNPWVDPLDGFDYGAAAQSRHQALPRTLSMTGAADSYLGHPTDARRFLKECGLDPSTLHIVGRRFGNRHDYEHINLLTHTDAVNDHFPDIVNWLSGTKVENQKS